MEAATSNSSQKAALHRKTKSPYVIQYGGDLPRARKSRPSYPFKDMEVGGWFEINPEKGDDAVEIKLKAAHVRSRAYEFQKKLKETGKKVKFQVTMKAGGVIVVARTA